MCRRNKWCGAQHAVTQRCACVPQQECSLGHATAAGVPATSSATCCMLPTWLLASAHLRCLPPAMLLPSQVGDLLSVPLGSYFDVPQGVLPEATHDYYKDPVLKVCMPA